MGRLSLLCVKTLKVARELWCDSAIPRAALSHSLLRWRRLHLKNGMSFFSPFSWERFSMKPQWEKAEIRQRLFTRLKVANAASHFRLWKKKERKTTWCEWLCCIIDTWLIYDILFWHFHFSECSISMSPLFEAVTAANSHNISALKPSL